MKQTRLYARRRFYRQWSELALFSAIGFLVGAVLAAGFCVAGV